VRRAPCRTVIIDEIRLFLRAVQQKAPAGYSPDGRASLAVLLPIPHMLQFAVSAGLVSGAVSAAVDLGGTAITKMVDGAVEAFEKTIELGGELGISARGGPMHG
jgi:hypothetical protein